MTIRNCSAKNTPARWFSLLLVFAVICAAPAQTKRAPRRAPARPAAKTGELAGLVRAWRESPGPARRAAVESYAAAHGRDNTGALARLALGIGAYEQKDYAAAIDSLRKIEGKLAQLADYAGYYLAAARMESNDAGDVRKELAAARATAVRSPLSGKAWLLEARTLQATDAASGIRTLREHYAELPQPDGDVTLADCYQAAKELDRAADFYQRVYYQHITGDAALHAASALAALKETMGAAYPEPLPEQILHRAGRLMELREYARAGAEYLSLSGQLTGLARDQARVRVGAADYFGGNGAAAYQYLRGLELPESEADAERLYYLEECARRLNSDEGMMAALNRLGAVHPQSPWRLRALVSVANRYLLANRPDDYIPLYKAVYEDFPSEPAAGLCHWKVTFQAYLRGKSEAADLLREHLRTYSPHPTTGAALYFLGRQAERDGDPGAARAYYQRLAEAYQNHYYALLARERLAQPEVAGAPVPDAAVKFLADVRMARANPVPAESTRETTIRIERSRLLRTAGLADLSDGELRFGARTAGQPSLLAIEMAGAAEAPHLAVRIMKVLVPDYLNLRVEQAPRKFWELLFPLPYRNDLVQNARERDLDPYLVAGLIRQESEFNPQAVSRANAYGLTQVRPGTGRIYARRLGMQRFTNRVLFQPGANLRIGTSILRGMLDQNGGNLQQTLAAYNAGPNRLAEWLSWNTYREPAEFVESIPFTETRDYVQAVLRNADMYRRLYK